MSRPVVVAVRWRGVGCGGAALARCGCAVGLQAYVGGAAAHYEKQGYDYQQGYYALYLKRGAPTGGQCYEREYLNVDRAAEWTRHSGYAEREVAAAVEEIHGCGGGVRLRRAWGLRWCGRRCRRRRSARLPACRAIAKKHSPAMKAAMGMSPRGP